MNNIQTKNDGSLKWVIFIIVIFGSYLTYSITVTNPKLDKEYLKEYFIVQGRIKSLPINTTFGPTLKTKVEYTVQGELLEKELFYQFPCRNSEVKNDLIKSELFAWKFPVAISK